MITTLYRGHEYFLIWSRKGSVTVQRGTVGHRGIRSTITVSDEKSKDVLERELQAARQEGFDVLGFDQLNRIVVHYKLPGWSGDDLSSFEMALKDILGNELTWTGNGF